MRLPWPFGRRAPHDGPSSAGRDAPASEATAVAPAARTSEAPPTGAWATLPPIQRTLGTAPLVAPSPPFLADVPGHRPLPPIVEPLGHDAGPEAPTGLVAAQARPVPSLTSSAPLPPRPVQRRAEPDGDAAGLPWDAGVSGEPAQSIGSEDSDAVGPTAIDAVRTLAPVPPAATVQPAARPLTQAPSQPVPVQRSGRGTPPPPAGDRPSPGPGIPARETAPAATRPSLPLQRAGGRWAESTSGERRPPVVAQPGDGDSGVARPGLGAPISAPPATGSPAGPPAGAGTGTARRPGLGAPISVPPATAVTQRLPMRPGPARPAADARTSGAPAQPPEPAPRRSATVAEPAAPPRPLPALPVARQPAGASGPANVAPAVPSSRTLADDRRPPRLPILGARPLRPAASVVQREATSRPREPQTGSATPVPARWTAADDLPATITAQRRPAAAAAREEPVALDSLGTTGARLASAAHGASQGTPGLREIVFPAPEPGPAAPPGGADRAAAPSSPSLQRLAETDADLGPAAAGRAPSRAPARGSAGRTAPVDLALARPSVGPGAPAAGPATSTAAGRATPVVQATRIDTGPGLPAFTATPVVQRIDGRAPEPAGGDEEHSDAELDELAGALFGRIRSRLRAEVIHEREARGLTFDAF